MISKEFSGAPIHQFARCGVSAGSFKGQNHPGASEKLVGSWSFCCFGMGLTVCILDLQRHWCSSELWCYIGVEAVTGSLWLTGQITQGQFDLVVFVQLAQCWAEQSFLSISQRRDICSPHAGIYGASAQAYSLNIKIKRISWHYMLASWTYRYDWHNRTRIAFRTP